MSYKSPFTTSTDLGVARVDGIQYCCETPSAKIALTKISQ